MRRAQEANDLALAVRLDMLGHGGAEEESWRDGKRKCKRRKPEKEIVVEFIKNEDYKYVRALGAYYLRLTGR